MGPNGQQGRAVSYLEGVLRALWKLVAGAILSLAMTVGTAHALTLQQIGAGFEQPVYVTSDPGNPNRLFVVERKGTIALVQNGEVKPFADISSEVSCCEGERGLLSIALAPDFDSSGRFFLYYTGKLEPGEIHVAQMVASGNSAATSTLRDVIPPIPHPGHNNHDGGQLQFGPEGALFFGTGDGGGENDEEHNAQDPTRELGKLLRLPSPGPLKKPEIWSLGLRNPFRFSFDRLTGDLWMGDVGQGEREEVDFAAAPSLGEGANYGWNCMEGSIQGPATDPQCAFPPTGGYVSPVFDYPHEDPGGGRAFGCAVIGGFVARDPGLGELYGRYVYGDLCQGEIRSFCPGSPAATDRSEHALVNNLNSFGEDSSGRLYAVSGNGPVYRLAGAGGAPCPTAGPVYTPSTTKAQSPSFIGIRAAGRKVRRHRRGLISVWVAPCNGRRGDAVTLWRGRRNLGTRFLDRACSARFRPRIDRRSSFRATVRADADYLPAISRKLTIKPVRRYHPHR
jgi:hypothetical protein